MEPGKHLILDFYGCNSELLNNYEQLKDLLDANPDLKPVLRKIDDELAPHIYSQFVGKLLTQALQI